MEKSHEEDGEEDTFLKSANESNPNTDTKKLNSKKSDSKSWKIFFSKSERLK